jgi:hypothetical protein
MSIQPLKFFLQFCKLAYNTYTLFLIFFINL